MKEKNQKEYSSEVIKMKEKNPKEYNSEEPDLDLEEDDDEQRYTPSATYGYYSPSCPWNAPGMSIHDFI